MLLLKLSIVSKDKLAIDGEILPSRFMFGRFKAMTLWFCGLQVTPNQEQNEVFVVQFLERKEELFVMSCLKDNKASMSVSFVEVAYREKRDCCKTNRIRKRTLAFLHLFFL